MIALLLSAAILSPAPDAVAWKCQTMIGSTDVYVPTPAALDAHRGDPRPLYRIVGMGMPYLMAQPLGQVADFQPDSIVFGWKSQGKAVEMVIDFDAEAGTASFETRIGDDPRNLPTEPNESGSCTLRTGKTQ